MFDLQSIALGRGFQFFTLITRSFPCCSRTYWDVKNNRGASLSLASPASSPRFGGQLHAVSGFGLGLGSNEQTPMRAGTFKHTDDHERCGSCTLKVQATLVTRRYIWGSFIIEEILGEVSTLWTCCGHFPLHGHFQPSDWIGNHPIRNLIANHEDWHFKLQNRG